MNRPHDPLDCEPTLDDLAEIATEWPVIEAEMAVVAAECRMSASPDALSVRAHRRAVAALAARVRAHSATSPRTSGARPDAA
jgi:hypothetical protein